MPPPHFCLKKRKVDKSETKLLIYQIEEKKCLTEDQAKYIYKMVEQNKSVNVHTMKQEIEDDKKKNNKRE